MTYLEQLNGLLSQVSVDSPVALKPPCGCAKILGVAPDHIKRLHILFCGAVYDMETDEAKKLETLTRLKGPKHVDTLKAAGHYEYALFNSKLIRDILTAEMCEHFGLICISGIVTFYTGWRVGHCTGRCKEHPANSN